MGLGVLLADRLKLDEDAREPFAAEVEKLLRELRREMSNAQTLGNIEFYDVEMFVLDLWAQIRTADEESDPITRIVCVTMTQDEDGYTDSIRTAWANSAPGDMLVACEALRRAAGNRIGQTVLDEDQE